MTSRAVCYRIELAVAKPFMPGLASQIPQLDIQTILPNVKNIIIRPKVHRHTFILLCRLSFQNGGHNDWAYLIPALLLGCLRMLSLQDVALDDVWRS